MANIVFIKDIIVLSQSVRGIHHTTRFGEYLDFNEIDENDCHINYDVLTHKTNKRDHLIILEFGIHSKDNNLEENRDSPIKNEFHIVVEGHYKVPEYVDEDHIYDAIHFAALANLLAFLRTSVQGITSFSYAGPYYVPLIKLDELHKQFKKNPKPKEKRKKTKPNPSTTKRK